MLIENIINYCNNQYLYKQKCNSCSYGCHCPNGNCEDCLQYIHFPARAPVKRKYDCANMANYYTCKYAYKYMSEIVYALEKLDTLSKEAKLKVMSVGCGPCTDLFALDFLREAGKYKFENVEFRGIDIAKDVWGNIHQQITTYKPDIYATKFFYEDVITFIDTIMTKQWYPDIIIFQYVFSDMHKNCNEDDIEQFIYKISCFINKLPTNTCIVINDINLDISRGGCRESFDKLLNQIIGCSHVKLHFNNCSRNTHFDYGHEYKRNCLVTPNPAYISSYNPFESCSSAQLIIKKE